MVVFCLTAEDLQAGSPHPLIRIKTGNNFIELLCQPNKYIEVQNLRSPKTLYYMQFSVKS